MQSYERTVITGQCQRSCGPRAGTPGGFALEFKGCMSYITREVVDGPKIKEGNIPLARLWKVSNQGVIASKGQVTET
jgi:hypothetical protein